MGTQHSGLREDNNKTISLFNYLLSHAPTAGRAIVRYRVWGGNRVSAAPNNRARLTGCKHTTSSWHLNGFPDGSTLGEQLFKEKSERS